MAATAILNENTLQSAASSSKDSAAAAADLDLVGTYQVFLSFRGKDTRYGFTDYLYRDLLAAGVHTFRDDNELRVGEEIGPELIKALRDSKISIPIFSKNYADSKWCLRELGQMVECNENWGQKIFPIFYDVEPSEVQHYERGSYNDAFVKYENDPSLDQKTVEQWKKALAIVGELKGLELKKETNGLEGALVKIVVQKVVSKLKKNNMHLPQTLVGIENHMERLKGLLTVESNGVRIIGILGMSGMGKTTIAKAIYNELNEFFESHCFIEDVGGESQRHNGLLHLQKLLLPKILNGETRNINNVDEGTDKIKDAILGKKVFIVLDNVNDMFQIEKLAVNHRWYGAGSRIIITTTNEDVLLAIKVECEGDGKCDIYKNYEPQLMGEEDALKLFSKCAFKRECPPQDYLELAKEVVSHAGGLPLVLETLGSALSIEKNKVSWEQKLKKLQEIPPHKVFDRLRISYDALDWGQKQIFLDIACFFVGVPETMPVYMWDSCGFHPSEGIKALVRRSLVTFREDGKIIMMHDRLRELGKQIIKENLADPGERSRLWDHNEALVMLEKHPGLKKVEALRLKFEVPNPNLFCSRGAPSNSLSRRVRVFKSYVKKDWEYTYPRLAGEDFAKLPKLRYLKVAFAELVGDFKGLHSELRWLEWMGCLGISTPNNIYLKNLVILDLSNGRIRDNWKCWSQIKMAEKLKVLNLSCCFDLESVPHLSNFTSLENLELCHCCSLRRLDGLEQLTSLTYLGLEGCESLKILPDLSKMGKLRTLDMQDCGKLKVVQGLEKLESLEVLDMRNCRRLERLPNLSNLQKLTSFCASRCTKLIEIQGLDGLRSLEHFDLTNCESLERLGDLSNLKKLRKLDTSWWKVTELHGLGELESLEQLEICYNKLLDRISDLSKLRRLRVLEFRLCDKLIEIQGLHGLESLERFNMTQCPSINRVTNLSNLKRLKVLTIIYCKELTEIRGLEELETLEMLDISGCESIVNLPLLSNLKNLKFIKVSRCENLTKMEGLEELESLEVLDIGWCKSIENVHLSNLKNLKDIDASWCEKLNEIQGLEELESLKVFIITGCKSIENIPDLSNLKNLILIDFSYCEKLTEIPGLERLKSLNVTVFKD